MARPFATAFYHSLAWKRTQAAYMKTPIVRGCGVCPPLMCESCFDRGILRPAAIVHHKVHLTPANIGDPSVTLDQSNLMRVCRDCHAELHRHDRPYGGGPHGTFVAFDEPGHPVGRVER